MPKWVERAKAAMGKQESNQSQRLNVNEIIEQGTRIADDIRFVMESSGAKIADELKANLTGLNCVESFYRAAVKTGNPIELGIDNFERLMAVMLGQCIVESKGGQWVEYTGRYHVLDPAVIQLASGKHVDVFMFCKSLSKKPSVSGANHGLSLSSFVENADRMSFP